jgi:hypothetical protein
MLFRSLLFSLAQAQALQIRYAQALRTTGPQSLFSHYESEIKYLKNNIDAKSSNRSFLIV